jgi:putative Holliday junction resolvase
VTTGSPGRVLGLDLGGARIGVAVSDPDRRLAVPHGTIAVGQPPADVKAVAALVAELDVTDVVVGHPLGLSGRAGEAAHHAERFAEVLREVLKLPVHLQDERLTTTEAERSLADAGVRGPDLRRVVDQVAASVLLQAWLDRERCAPEAAPPGGPAPARGS